MRMYRVDEGANPEGWPFLQDGHAYLGDGTPLTDVDEDGRIVPSRQALVSDEKICSGGVLSLADRQSGVEALARALDNNDLVRAPILLLQLQIDPDPALAKFNHFHKPPGPGGGQFASGPEAGAAATAPSGLETASFNMHVGLPGSGVAGTPVAPPPGFEQVAATLGVSMTSTYVPGVYGKDIDIAHALVTDLVWMAILTITKPGFTPGTKGYGIALHNALAVEVRLLGDPELHAEQAYFKGFPVPIRLPFSSVPDVLYGSIWNPKIVWDLKTGRSARDISAADTQKQKEETLENVRGSPFYEYIQVYGP
ncbi:MAG TPA: hypothetical protein VKZ79_03575 [Alphaproteobacteria bacterium]|nr:hypothetical protein [Alphaproteobacteria bacterium]